MSKSNSLSEAIARSPLVWGGGVCLGFYGLVSAGVLKGRFIESYFAGHPVEYVAAAMFFVGMAALALKIVEISVERLGLGEPLLGPVPEGGQSVADCRLLAARLDRLPGTQQKGYLVRRLRDAVEYVRRSGSADDLDEELRYLADVDAARMHGSYGLVRLIIWAIPVLGFLGTVIGITLAIGALSFENIESSGVEMVVGLKVAFFTTAQALGLSIVLMFTQFLIDRKESELLAEVDRRTAAEMVGRFERVAREADGQLGTVRQMIEAVIAGTEQLVRRQSDLWQSTLDTAAQRWATMADSSGKQLQTALAGALSGTLRAHAAELVAGEQRFAEANRQNWERTQRALVLNTETVASLNESVREEAELIGQAIQAVGQVTSLEESLNNNLRALAGSKNFEETVMSLAAAIHLLNSRLGPSPDQTPSVQLETRRKTDQAA